MTVVNPSSNGFITVYPCGDLPTTSSVNFGGGSVVSNEVVAQVHPSNGRICLYSSSSTDLVVDVSAHLPAIPKGLAPVSPQRLLDTRPTGTTIDGAELGAANEVVASLSSDGTVCC